MISYILYSPPIMQNSYQPLYFFVILILTINPNIFTYSILHSRFHNQMSSINCDWITAYIYFSNILKNCCK